MNVTLTHATQQAESLIVEMARVSNPDNAKNSDTAPKLLRYLIKHKHWSPFEMASMCVKIETERDIAAQILRHRSFSFQEFCLAGNSRITVKAPGGAVQRIPISELYQLWQSKRFKARLARAYDCTVGRFIEVPILSVYASGLKPVYEFTIKATSSVKTISCTREHRVLTKESGFVSFGEAFDKKLTVALNGVNAEPLLYQQKEIIETNAWMGSDRFAKEYNIAAVTARKWFRRHNIKPENPRNWPASKINLNFEGKLTSFMKWARLKLLVDYCQKCGHDGSAHRLELSHIFAHDLNVALAFDPSNLQTLCSSCHRDYDQKVQGKRYGWTLGMTAKWGKITNQYFLGIQETYDIEMDHPTHNFVADGVVVHNSQRYAKTSPAEMIQVRRQDEKNRQNSIDDFSADEKEWAAAKTAVVIANSYLVYEELLELGVAKECARRVLPLCTPTTLYMHGNLRSWIHYIDLRTEKGTQLEHRDIANKCKEIFTKKFPSIAHAAFEE